MSKNFNTNTTNSDEWLTPPEIIKSLGDFNVDPCSPINRPWDTANIHYNINDNGLQQEWVGRVWLNPPYGRETFKWIEKLYLHSISGCSAGTALIFARTETKGFHEFIWDKAQSVFFFKGRLKFHKVDGSVKDVANAPSCLVSYSYYDTCMIKKSGLNGKLVQLR